LLQQQNVWFCQQNVWLLRKKFLVAATKILFVVPNFVAVTKPFFPCRQHSKAYLDEQSGLCVLVAVGDLDPQLVLGLLFAVEGFPEDELPAGGVEREAPLLRGQQRETHLADGVRVGGGQRGDAVAGGGVFGHLHVQGGCLQHRRGVVLIEDRH